MFHSVNSVYSFNEELEEADTEYLMVPMCQRYCNDFKIWHFKICELLN